MPLLRIDELKEGVRLGLWRITEQTCDLPRPCVADLSSYHGGRLLEKLVTYALLHRMTGHNDLTIGHLPSGKPFLPQMHISVSHTKGWAALMLSTKGEVAVDIEYVSTRVSRVVSRFMREDEVSHSLRSQLICWSAKETTYKFFSDDRLAFFDMRMAPLDSSDSGVLTMENLPRQQFLPVHYDLTPDYVLTWAVGEEKEEVLS